MNTPIDPLSSRERRRSVRRRKTIYATAALLALAVAFGILHATREASGGPAALEHGRVAVVPQRLPVSTQRLTGREASTMRSMLSARSDDVSPAPGDVPIEHGRTLVRGKVWSFVTFKNTRGETCGGESIPTEGQGVGCNVLGDLFRSVGPIAVGWGGRQEENTDQLRWTELWLDGFVAPSVRRLELVYSDCSTEAIPIDSSGVVFSFASPTKLASDIWPIRLDGFAGFRRMASRPLPVDWPSPGGAATAGLNTPDRSACG